MSDAGRLPQRAFSGLSASAPTLISLNDDVLLHLLRTLTSKEHLSLIATCRYLFNKGLPVLLARQHLITSKTLKSFYKFLDFFAPASFTSLRNLHFYRILWRADLSTISKILQRATNLHTLGTCALNRPIVKAIVSLSKLRKLEVEEADSCNPRSILRRSNAPLVRLSVEVEDDTMVLLPLLSKFQLTLEDLHLQRVTMMPLRFSCLKLTRLSMWYCPNALSLKGLVYAFPNLEVLAYRHIGEDFHDDRSPYEKMRNENITFQKTRSLDSLVSLTTDEEGLYTLGFQRELDSLRLPSPIGFWPHMSFDWLQDSLRLNRPRHLQISCYNYVSTLKRALSVGTERLDRLDLLLDVPSRPEPDLMDSVFAAVATLSIRMFYCDISVSIEEEDGITDELQKLLDMEQIAQRALDSAPTLNHVKIKIMCKTDRQSYWEVCGDKSNRRLRAVQSEHEKVRINRMFLPPQIQDDDYETPEWFF